MTVRPKTCKQLSVPSGTCSEQKAEERKRMVSHEFLVPVNSSAASFPPARADSPQRRDGHKMSLNRGGGTWEISVKSDSYGFLFQLSSKRANHSVQLTKETATRPAARGEGGAGGRQRISTHRHSVTHMTQKTVRTLYKNAHPRKELLFNWRQEEAGHANAIA